MNLLVIPNDIFRQTQAIKPLDSNENERRQMKYSCLDLIKSKVKRRWDKAIKLTRVIDEIIFKATDRGYSFNGRQTLAKLCDCGLSTVDEALRVLRESGEVVIGYRENPNSNGYKTPVVFLKNHPHFKYWNDLLGLGKYVKQEVHQEVEYTEKPCDSKDEGAKKVSTYLLPSLKQESNNISDNTIVQFVVNRVNDTIKKGTRVKYLSSYIDRVVRSLEWQAMYDENNRQKAIMKRQQEESLKVIREIKGIKREPIPFYNWLGE